MLLSPNVSLFNWLWLLLLLLRFSLISTKIELWRILLLLTFHLLIFEVVILGLFDHLAACKPEHRLNSQKRVLLLQSYEFSNNSNHDLAQHALTRLQFAVVDLNRLPDTLHQGVVA